MFHIMRGIIAIYGFRVSAKKFEDAWISWKNGTPDWANLFFAIIGIILTMIILTFARMVYRSFLNYIDNLQARKKFDEKPLYKTAGKPGAIEKILLKALIFLCLILCCTGFGQYIFLPRQKIFLHLLQAHQNCGKLSVPIFILYLFFLIKRHYNLKIAFLVALYPILFVWVLLAPTPLLLSLIFLNGIFLPAGLFLIVLPHVGNENRARTCAAAIFLYGFTLALLTGFYATMNPVILRFSFYHRIFHAFLAPCAVFLPIHFLFNLWTSKKSARFEWKKVYAAGTVLLLSVVGGAALHAIKNWEFQKIRRENVYPTRRLADESGMKFRNIPNNAFNGERLCSFCHSVPYMQWARSAHAFAARTISFQKTVKTLMDKHGAEIGRECASCHDPEVALSEDPRILIDPEHIKRSQGVSCRACHYMSVSKGKNALYAIDLPRSDLILESATVSRGQFGPLDIRSAPGSGNLIAKANYIFFSVLEHVGDVTKPITKNGSVCFSCHSLESVRKGHKKIPLDNVSSFQASKFSKIMPCHRCHMPRIEQDEHSYSWMDHSFFGIQQELPQVVISRAGVKKTELEKFTRDTGKWIEGNLPVLETWQVAYDETLKSYRIYNYARAVREINETRKVALGGSHFTMAVEKEAIRGSKLFLTLSTLNRNVSHDFPSSLFANIVEVWFELEVDDASGRKLYFSGYDNNDYSHRLGRIEVDERGLPIVPADSLRYVEIVNKKFLHPGKKYFETYSIPIKPQIRFPLKAKYRLMYRRYSKDFAVWMSDGAIQSFPARVIAEKEFVIAEKPGRR